MKTIEKLFGNALCRGIMLLLFVLLNVQVFAYDFYVDGIYYNITSSNTVEVANGGESHMSAPYSGDITIPESVTYNGVTYNVTAIGRLAFYDCENLTDISIPESVTEIGNLAFYYCSSLTSINIPDGVTEIGFWTFSWCTSLKSISIPDGVTSIGECAFNECESLTEIILPDAVTKIGDKAFWNCWSLTSINIPDGVTEIGEQTFYYCRSLTSINIPDNTTSIGFMAFYCCESMISATIGSSVTEIGDKAFLYCDNLIEINSKNPMPPTISSSLTFDGVDKNTCILNVPIGSKELYANADYWSEFYNINEVEFPASIENVRVDGKEVEEVGRYTLNGTRIDTPQRGTNIIRYSDGSTRKVIVK